MKRLLSLLLIGSLLLSLTACGSQSDSLIEDEPDLNLKEGGTALGESNYTPSVSLNEIKKQEEEKRQQEIAANAIGAADPEVIEERKETPMEQLSPVDQTRPDTNFGACRSLKGKVGVVLFFIDDKESKWTQDEAKTFTKNELQPALEFIEKEATARNIKLDLSIKKVHTAVPYEGTVITSVERTGKASISVMKQMARDLKYSSDTAMFQDFKDQYKCDEVLFIAIFNKPGSSYALLNTREKEPLFEEHCIFFSKELDSGKELPAGMTAAPLAHELLRLYGAQVFFSSIPRKTLAKLHFNSDIMLSTHVNVMTNLITDATAFYIGWQDTPPEILSHADWNT